MSKQVIVGGAEYLEPADYERFSQFPQAAIDDAVGDALAYPAHWSAFTVTRQSAQEVTISPGRYYQGRIVYEADEISTVNLTVFLPLAAGDEKWVALIARGETVTMREERAFETSTNPETSDPVLIPTPVIEARRVNITVQQGIAAPPPARKPVIAETDGCIAFVRLTTSGVQDIVPGEKWRVKTLAEVEGRVTAVELRIYQLGEETESLRTNLANTAAAIARMPDHRLFEQVVRDTARHSQRLNLPDEARNYWFDQALVRDDWDFAAGGMFRINEGIRFQYASQRDQTLRLRAYDDPQISIWDNQLVLPAYEEVPRISVPEGTGRLDIASVVHTITTATQHTVAHERVRYGETINVCENKAGWGVIGERRAGETFRANGEEWVSGGQTSNPWNQTAIAQNGHAEFAAQRVIRETYYETYTTYNTEQFGLSGAIHGQTFLNSQVMVATSIDIPFTRIGDTGDVTLCLCKVNASGALDFNGVLARTTVLRDALRVGWTKFRFTPTLLDQGQRYGWFMSTPGNHQIQMVSGNVYSGGSRFVCTDGVWAQGSTTEDLPFRLNGARFKANRVVLPFEPIGPVENGMTEIEMVYKTWAPAATSLVWEVRAQGDKEWVPIDPRVNNPLANLPPLVELRMVMIGTPDVAPAIILDRYARVTAGRMRLDMVAITKPIEFGFATAQAQIVLHMDAFDKALHTATPKIVLDDNTVVSPLSVVATVDQDKPSRTKFVANFKLPAGTKRARARVDATTTNVTQVPFGQDIQLCAF